MKLWIPLLIAIYPNFALADGNRTPTSNQETQEGTATLNVTGQVRTLSMLPVPKSGKEKLEFGKPRTSYKDKIPKTTL
jgi:hypothetical protein